MKIAYCTDTYLPQINGVTRTLEKLSSYLLKKNIEHIFLAPDYPDISLEMQTKPPVKRFKSISFPLYSECRLSLPIYSNVRSALDTFRADLIHLVTPMGIGLSGLRYAREKNLPVVSSFHTNFDSYLKYYKLDYLEEVLWMFFKWFHKFSHINFCPSNDTLRILQSKGIENTRIWSRGIDTKLFNSNYRNHDLRKKLDLENKTAFLYTGRIAAEKDLDILMESIFNINKVYKDEVRFIFAGDGPYTSHLKSISPENATFLGYLKGIELSEIYASCDVFAFPSSTETFGNVVLEAMSSGLPVIGVASGGIKELVIDKYNGILCPPGNVQSFTDAMAFFIKNKLAAASMSANARVYTLKRSWDSVFENLISDYCSLFKESSLNAPKSA